MISTFNLQKLGDLLKDFYTLTRIRITVFDETFRELAACPEEVAPFCQVIRTDPEAARRCRLCDTLACQTASQRRCRNYNIDMDALKDACFERPLIPKDYITSATHIMQAVASYLCMERMAYLRQESLPVRIDEYISRHFTGDMDIETLCEHFQIGRTRLYEIARENYGMGIAENVRRLRIEKAKVLLEEEPRMSVAQIASECGFGDYNYFITVFKKLTGYAPGAYRRRNGDK